MKVKTYGFVFGRYWGGGEGASDMSKETFDSIEEMEQYYYSLKDYDFLDAVMGYEKVLGALIYVELHDTIEKDDREWHCVSSDGCFFIGDLTDKQEDFLKERCYSLGKRISVCEL